ncbi:MAG: hypothetical protein V3U98_11850, partial [Acidobacteriota bacterium]
MNTSILAPPGTKYSAIVQAILSGQAPAPARLAAARGALPVTRPERLLLCVHLRTDGDSSIQEAARQRLATEAREDLAAALVASETLAAPVLDYFARCPDLEPAVLEKLAVHPQTGDEALEVLASCPHASVLERIVLNQTRLLARPEIVRRLESNAHLSTTSRRLLLQFKHDFWERGIDKVVLTRPKESLSEAGPAEALEPQGAAADVDPCAPAAEAQPEAPPAAELSEEEFSEEAFQVAYVRIMHMTVPEKIQLSMKANREERALLVRDSNKQVSTSVLKSPKLADNEIESIANMRNVSGEVLRLISINKMWTRNYSVIHSLCRNPKTPVGMTLRFLPRLNNRDLKNLQSDKNITDALRKL